MQMSADLSIETLNDTSVGAWNDNAAFWDAYMASDGNDFVQELELPAIKKMVALKQGETLLDIGTGNGLIARKMLSLGAVVTAVDASSNMIEIAKDRSIKEGALGIDYRTLDVTKTDQLDNLIREKVLHFFRSFCCIS